MIVDHDPEPADHRPRREPTAPSTEAGSDGYRAGTPGYPVFAELEAYVDSSGDGSGDEGGAPESSEPGATERGDPFWRRLGFSSHAAYMEYLEALQAPLDRFHRPRTPRDPPTPALPGEEISDVGRPRSTRPVRQVGIKLDFDDYETLARAAELYGIRPSTMARLLVNRGARAALDMTPDAES